MPHAINATAKFYRDVASVIKGLGGKPAETTIRMRLATWNELKRASGPPQHVEVAMFYRELADKIEREDVAPDVPVNFPSIPQDGEVAGMLHGARVIIDTALPLHIAVCERDGGMCRVEAGPFEPMQEPTGGWALCRPLIAPPQLAS